MNASAFFSGGAVPPLTSSQQQQPKPQHRGKQPSPLQPSQEGSGSADTHYHRGADHGGAAPVPVPPSQPVAAFGNNHGRTRFWEPAPRQNPYHPSTAQQQQHHSGGVEYHGTQHQPPPAPLRSHSRDDSAELFETLDLNSATPAPTDANANATNSGGFLTASAGPEKFSIARPHQRHAASDGPGDLSCRPVDGNRFEYEGVALQTALHAFGSVGSVVGSVAGGVRASAAGAAGGAVGVGTGLAGGLGSVMGAVTPSKLAGGMAGWRGRLADVVAPVDGASTAPEEARRPLGTGASAAVASAAEVFAAPSPEVSPMLTGMAPPVAGGRQGPRVPLVVRQISQRPPQLAAAPLGAATASTPSAQEVFGMAPVPTATPVAATSSAQELFEEPLNAQQPPVVGHGDHEGASVDDGANAFFGSPPTNAPAVQKTSSETTHATTSSRFGAAPSQSVQPLPTVGSGAASAVFAAPSASVNPQGVPAVGADDALLAGPPLGASSFFAGVPPSDQPQRQLSHRLSSLEKATRDSTTFQYADPLVGRATIVPDQCATSAAVGSSSGGDLPTAAAVASGSSGSDLRATGAKPVPPSAGELKSMEIGLCQTPVAAAPALATQPVTVMNTLQGRPSSQQPPSSPLSQPSPTPPLQQTHSTTTASSVPVVPSPATAVVPATPTAFHPLPVPARQGLRLNLPPPQKKAPRKTHLPLPPPLRKKPLHLPKPPTSGNSAGFSINSSLGGSKYGVSSSGSSSAFKKPPPMEVMAASRYHFPEVSDGGMSPRFYTPDTRVSPRLRSATSPWAAPPITAETVRPNRTEKERVERESEALGVEEELERTRLEKEEVKSEAEAHTVQKKVEALKKDEAKRTDAKERAEQDAEAVKTQNKAEELRIQEEAKPEQAEVAAQLEAENDRAKGREVKAATGLERAAIQQVELGRKEEPKRENEKVIEEGASAEIQVELLAAKILEKERVERELEATAQLLAENECTRLQKVEAEMEAERVAFQQAKLEGEEEKKERKRILEERASVEMQAELTKAERERQHCTTAVINEAQTPPQTPPLGFGTPREERIPVVGDDCNEVATSTVRDVLENAVRRIVAVGPEHSCAVMVADTTPPAPTQAGSLHVLPEPGSVTFSMTTPPVPTSIAHSTPSSRVTECDVLSDYQAQLQEEDFNACSNDGVAALRQERTTASTQQSGLAAKEEGGNGSDTMQAAYNHGATKWESSVVVEADRMSDYQNHLTDEDLLLSGATTEDFKGNEMMRKKGEWNNWKDESGDSSTPEQIDGGADAQEEVAPTNELLAGWMEVTEPSSGNIYYCNQITGESSWARPVVHDTTVSEAETAGVLVTAKEVATAGYNEDPVLHQDEGLLLQPGNEVLYKAEEEKSIEDLATMARLHTEKLAPAVGDNPTLVTLPEGWIEATDTAKGNVYYYNEVTGESVWDRPPPVATKDTAKQTMFVDEEVEEDLLTEASVDEPFDDPFVCKSKKSKEGGVNSDNRSVHAAEIASSDASEQEEEELSVQCELSVEQPSLHTQESAEDFVNARIPDTAERQGDQEVSTGGPAEDGISAAKIEGADFISDAAMAPENDAPLEAQRFASEREGKKEMGDIVDATAAAVADIATAPETKPIPVSAEQKAESEANSRGGNGNTATEEKTDSTAANVVEMDTYLQIQNRLVEDVDKLAEEEDWVEATDPTSGKIYYYSSTTGATSWIKPMAPASEVTPRVKASVEDRKGCQTLPGQICTPEGLSSSAAMGAAKVVLKNPGVVGMPQLISNDIDGRGRIR